MLEHGKKLTGVDCILAVIAPVSERIQRVKQRDHFRTEAQIEQIIQHQLSDKEVREKADYLIDNADRSAVIPQINSLLHNLKNQL